MIASFSSLQVCGYATFADAGEPWERWAAASARGAGLNLARLENGPFIDGLPIKNGDFPWLC